MKTKCGFCEKRTITTDEIYGTWVKKQCPECGQISRYKVTARGINIVHKDSDNK